MFTKCLVLINFVMKTYAQNCEYVLPDGMKYNLSNLQQATDMTFIIGKYQYKSNLCGPLKFACSLNSQAPAAIFKKSINYLTKRLTVYELSCSIMESTSCIYGKFYKIIRN